MYKSYVAVAPNPEEFPEAARPDGRVHAQAVRLVGGRQEADDAGDARLRRQRHVSARSTSSKFYQLLGGGLKDAGWQREHMSQNRLAILPEPHALRHVPRAAAGRRPCCRSSTARPARRAGPSRWRAAVRRIDSATQHGRSPQLQREKHLVMREVRNYREPVLRHVLALPPGVPEPASKDSGEEIILLLIHLVHLFLAGNSDGHFTEKGHVHTLSKGSLLKLGWRNCCFHLCEIFRRHSFPC